MVYQTNCYAQWMENPVNPTFKSVTRDELTPLAGKWVMIPEQSIDHFN